MSVLATLNGSLQYDVHIQLPRISNFINIIADKLYYNILYCIVS